MVYGYTLDRAQRRTGYLDYKEPKAKSYRRRKTKKKKVKAKPVKEKPRYYF